MSQTDPKDEQKQLNKISASIKDKKAEVNEFDEQMKVKQAGIDKQLAEITKYREDLVRDIKDLDNKQDDYDKARKKLDTQLQEIDVKRLSLDRLAQASDDRLQEAIAKEAANEAEARKIDARAVAKEDDHSGLKLELESKMANIEELKRLKEQEYLKAQDQLEALKTERQEIQDNKIRYETMVKEVTETKGELAAQLNKNKDLERSLQKTQIDLKNREQNCTNREKMLNDGEIELEAKWAKLNRKIEIMGFTQDLEEAKKLETATKEG